MAGSFAKISGHGAVLDTAVLDRITSEMKPKAGRIVSKYGYAILADAVKSAPRDPARPPINPIPLNTGALKSSLTSESRMTDETTFTISDGVEYGIYQEFGTSRIPARPFLRPAIEKWAARFQDAFKGLFQ
jgi:HK97 gp10 family phage protein